MAFRIAALAPEPFAHLFGADDETLAAHGAMRCIADTKPGFPCRVSLRDADIGESLLLLNYEHQPAATPYRSGHAIFVREGAVQAHPAIGEIPDVIGSRLLSVRAFDADGMMIDADVVDGAALALAIERMFAGAAAYLHLHNARPGCYAARVERA